MMSSKRGTDNYLSVQPEVNIGTAGHVDHGKTTLIQGLTGVWASKHSEEIRRGITIKLGYADCAIYKCPCCDAPQCYCTTAKCQACGSDAKLLRAISFVDCPGHEVLMTTMLSGAAVMDGALLIIAADEAVPQPQTREHMAALEVVGVKNIIVVQNKIDLVNHDQAIKNYKQIQEFLKGTTAERSPIVPISAQHKLNMDLLLEAIEKYIPTPKRDIAKPPYMPILRSFDINKPGTQAEKLVGGILGGSVVEGRLSVDTDIEISPGIKLEKTHYLPLHTKVTSLFAGAKQMDEVGCGGLVGVGSKLDPSLTKADGLIGTVLGAPGVLPKSKTTLGVETTLYKNAVGTTELTKVESIKLGEVIVINVGTAVTAGAVKTVHKDYIEIMLKKPVCTKDESRVALSRKILGKWRLIGYGVVKG